MPNLTLRSRASVEYGSDPDHRLSSPLTWSLSLDSDEFETHDTISPDSRPGSSRPETPYTPRRKRNSEVALSHSLTLDNLPEFSYAHCGLERERDFRLCELEPGLYGDVLRCRLVVENTDASRRQYRCLSYCWSDFDGVVERDEGIVVNECRFRVTGNLYQALKRLRRRDAVNLIWVDQICINQESFEERALQVQIMQFIFKNARRVVVWLGEEDDRSASLFEYARKLGKGSHGQSHALERILRGNKLQDAMQRLLQRRWFTRLWVLPEVALAKRISVYCGRSVMTWESLLKLIRTSENIRRAELSATREFDKRSSLLGNPRQRLAILSQMIASQEEERYHTDITQLLILAKSSRATDPRDMIYAFYGITHLTSYPIYTIPIPHLYTDTASHYLNSILYDVSYSQSHSLSDPHRYFQALSILYSAGTLHQHPSLTLPSWVPDWTYPWTLSPIWCTTTSNLPQNQTLHARDTWTLGIRTTYRAGGDVIETLEVVAEEKALKVSVYVFDVVTAVMEEAQASGLGASPVYVGGEDVTVGYGRVPFRTRGRVGGIAEVGVRRGDVLAIVVGGDVPVVLREGGEEVDGEGLRRFRLLCECLVESDGVMNGEVLAARMREMDGAEVVLLV